MHDPQHMCDAPLLGKGGPNELLSLQGGSLTQEAQRPDGEVGYVVVIIVEDMYVARRNAKMSNRRTKK
jgi:hypothetical protein